MPASLSPPSPTGRRLKTWPAVDAGPGVPRRCRRWRRSPASMPSSAIAAAPAADREPLSGPPDADVGNPDLHAPRRLIAGRKRRRSVQRCGWRGACCNPGPGEVAGPNRGLYGAATAAERWPFGGCERLLPKAARAYRWRERSWRSPRRAIRCSDPVPSTNSAGRAFSFWAFHSVTDHRLTKTLRHVGGWSRFLGCAEETLSYDDCLSCNQFLTRSLR